MKNNIRFLILLLTLMLAMSAFACGFTSDPVSEAAATPALTFSPAPSFTPILPIEDVVLAPSVEPETPVPTPDPTPTPEPTDTPTPTEIPFSYYAPTVNMSFEELVGCLDDFNEDDPMSDATFRLPQGYPAPDTYRIIVDLTWQVVLVYTKDENGEYTKPVRYMLCSTGSARVGGETRVSKPGKPYHMEPTKVRFGKFASSPESAQYWSLIFSKTYFHSTLYNKRRDLNSVQKASYEALGTKASHGCIRLTVPDARWIYYNICYDTEVEIRAGSKNDDETRAIREQLHLAPWKDNANITVAGTPYTDNWTIDEVEIDPNYPYVAATQPPVKNS